MKHGAIYYYDLYDFPKCFDCLSQAQEIATQAGIKDANIFIGFGCMYQTISEECNNHELGLKALSYYKQALKTGIETGDHIHTDMACTDVLSMAHSQGKGHINLNQREGAILPSALFLFVLYNQIKVTTDPEKHLDVLCSDS